MDKVFNIQWDASMVDAINPELANYPKHSKLEYSGVSFLYRFKREEIDFNDLGKQLNMIVATVSVFRQPPCRFTILHTDGLTKPEKNVWAVIFLKDWVFGQFFGYNNTIMEPWVAGEGMLWDGSIEHVAANVARVDKLTLIVSGLDTHG